MKVAEKTSVGETMVIPAGIEEFVPSQQVATLRVLDPTRLDPWYLGAWFTTEPAREQIRRLARGTAIQRLPVNDLASLTVMIPPLEDQREIGQRFRAFENAIQVHRSVTTCLQALRDVDLVVTFADAHVHDTGDAELNGNISGTVDRVTREVATLYEFPMSPEQGLSRAQASATFKKHGLNPRAFGSWVRGGYLAREGDRRWLTSKGREWADSYAEEAELLVAVKNGARQSLTPVKPAGQTLPGAAQGLSPFAGIDPKPGEVVAGSRFGLRTDFRAFEQ